MNKKQLIAAILLLATTLDKEVNLKGLSDDDLNTLHDELVAEKKSLDEEKTKESLSKQEKVVLEFIAPHKRYANGDVAGFDTEIAENILALKPAVAEVFQEEK